MAGLEVQIGADKTDFDKKIKEVEFDIKELSKVKLEKIRLGLDTKEINSQIKDAKANLTGLKTAVKDTGGAIGGMAPKVANGSNALMQFSRIAQDAPYGIIGIGNNITATAEAFSYLKTSTGSTGGALKAMASSLMGTGGILLGVSLLTTGLTLLSQSGLSVGDIIDKMTGKFDEFGGAIKKASEEAVKDTAGEVFGLKALVSAAQNKALSDKERFIAVENLQKQYPGYFGNLSKEQIMTSNLTGVVMELTKALVDRATAEKLASASADIQLGIYKSNAGLVKQKEQTLKLEKELALLVGNSSKDEIIANNQKFITVTNLNGQIRASKSAENDYRVEILKGTKAIEQRQKVMNQLTASSIGLEAPSIPKAKVAKVDPTPKVDKVNFLVPYSFTFVEEKKDLTSQQTIMNTMLAKDLEVFKNTPIPLKIPLQPILPIQDFRDAWGKLSEEIKASALNLTSITEQGLMGFGEAIGNAMSNGTGMLRAGGTAIIDTIGQFISGLGKEMVKMGSLTIVYAALIKALKSSFSNPYVLAAVSIALIAVGTAISSQSQKIAGGGGGTSSSSGSGANNSSYSSGGFSSSSNTGGTVVFEIAGQKLIGVLSNTLNANRRLGGQTTLGL